MGEQQRVRLILNEDEEHHHGQVLAKLLPGADRLECLAAFATNSGIEFILNKLRAGLVAGLEARFAIGLDCYLTEPRLLRTLLQLSKKYRLQLYITDDEGKEKHTTFHPKIYAISHSIGSTVLIGSANLTNGGLYGNYEASARIDDPNSVLMQSISRHIDELIEQAVLVPATKANIDNYERSYTIYQDQRYLADRHFERAKSQIGIYTETLRDILQEMKNNTSEAGFETQRNIRGENRKEAARRIIALASTEKLEADAFVKHFENLILLFHSGGLQRGKTVIATNADEFQAALLDIVTSKELTPGEAYQLLLDHFNKIPRAGVNLLTEILIAIDCERFAVMNQNAVSGLRRANIYDFPPKPLKDNVNAECYARYCQQADIVRQELGLANFTELDALFNYAYWRQEEEEEEEV